MATNRLPAASGELHDTSTISLEIGVRPQAACGSTLIVQPQKMNRRDVIDSVIRIVAAGFFGLVLIIILLVFAPTFENEKDRPGVYRISSDGSHEVVYLTHHYALHQFNKRETFVALSHYTGTTWGFTTGDVANFKPFENVIRVEKINGTDSFLITTDSLDDYPEDIRKEFSAGKAGILSNEQIEIFPNRKAAIVRLPSKASPKMMGAWGKKYIAPQNQIL